MEKKKILSWFLRNITYIVLILFILLAILLIYIITKDFSDQSAKGTIMIAAFSAFLSAITAFATMLQVVEINKQRRNSERPYVLSYFDDSSDGLISFIVENSGNSPALDVHINIDPSPINFQGKSISDLSLISNPIKFLPKGKLLRQAINVSWRFFQEGQPLKYSVEVKYSSIDGDVYNDRFEHNLDYLKQVTLPKKTIEDYLKIISENLSKK